MKSTLLWKSMLIGLSTLTFVGCTNTSAEPAPANSADLSYARQLASAACLDLKSQHAKQSEVLSSATPTPFYKVWANLEPTLKMATKATKLDPQWTPIEIYLNAERAYWLQFGGFAKEDGVFSESESAELLKYLQSMHPKIDEQMDEFNRACAIAGAFVELEPLG